MPSEWQYAYVSRVKRYVITCVLTCTHTHVHTTHLHAHTQTRSHDTKQSWQCYGNYTPGTTEGKTLFLTSHTGAVCIYIYTCIIYVCI